MGYGKIVECFVVLTRIEKHDSSLHDLVLRLEAKNRYDEIDSEVPVYWNGEEGDKAGQMDVWTLQEFNDRKDRFTYWEVKTGYSDKSLPTAKSQFNKVYSALKKNYELDDVNIRFVYYNPYTNTIKHYRPHNV